MATPVSLAVQPESCLDWRSLWLGERKDRDDTENAAFWNKKAVSFTATCQRSTYAQEYLELAGVRPGESVIDMGCGSGTLALPLASEGHQVTACDISTGMLDKLAEQAREAGIAHNIDVRELSWLASWDDLPVADVFLASRSLYSADLYETILKIERHARRRACITVSTQEAPSHDNTMLQAIGRAPSAKEEYVYIANLLMQMGRYPQIAYIAHVKPVFGSTVEEIRAEFEREDGPFTAEESCALDGFIARMFEPGEDGGAMRRAYERRVRWAFIAWDIPRAERRER